MFHSIWLVSLATEAGPGLLDAVARAAIHFQPNRASYWRELTVSTILKEFVRADRTEDWEITAAHLHSSQSDRPASR